MNDERDMNKLIDSLLRGDLMWKEVKELFVDLHKEEKEEKKLHNEAFVSKKEKMIVVIQKNNSEKIEDLGLSIGLNLMRGDIVKLEYDTYLKFKEGNIVKEVKLGK